MPIQNQLSKHYEGLFCQLECSQAWDHCEHSQVHAGHVCDLSIIKVRIVFNFTYELYN